MQLSTHQEKTARVLPYMNKVRSKFWTMWLCLCIFLRMLLPYQGTLADMDQSRNMSTLATVSTSARINDSHSKLQDDGRLKPKLLNVRSFLSNIIPSLASRERRTRQSTRDTNNSNNLWSLGYSAKEVKSIQENYPDIGSILTWKSTGNRPMGTATTTFTPELRHYWNYWNSMELHDGLLFKRSYSIDAQSSHLQFIVPKAMRSSVLRHLHNSLLSGHLGHRKTVGRILQTFYWYDLRTEVYIWIQKCDHCGANKLPPKRPRAPLGATGTGAPMDKWATDFLGPLPLTPRGNRFIFMVVTDLFSKWTEAYALPDQTAVTTAQCLLNGMISQFGCPLEILTDQGRNYERELFKELCKLLEIRKIRTSPRNPRCNGQVERYNNTLARMMRVYIKNDQTNWDLHLACLTSAYRSTPHESTKFTPNMIVLGREVRLPGTLDMPHSSEPSTSYGEYVTGLRQQLSHIHVIIRRHTEHERKRHKDIYDTRLSFRPCEPQVTTAISGTICRH